MQKRHNNDLDLPKFLFSGYTIHVLYILILYIICKHAKLKPLVTSLALQQLGEVDTVTKQEHVLVKFNSTQYAS